MEREARLKKENKLTKKSIEEISGQYKKLSGVIISRFFDYLTDFHEIGIGEKAFVVPIHERWQAFGGIVSGVGRLYFDEK